ncbi:hypothetical protein JKP88DRAFT_253640 [Tribonema minus]|uniref:Uncharacterized protein n=1 Tax=Tribonema minus TaxID=303371 RepID=A0A835Z912_9STRA|nr:hypothetical protein JKP88DRAFT_253640 [Tribonema minus]
MPPRAPSQPQEGATSELNGGESELEMREAAVLRMHEFRVHQVHKIHVQARRAGETLRQRVRMVRPQRHLARRETWRRLVPRSTCLGHRCEGRAKALRRQRCPTTAAASSLIDDATAVSGSSLQLPQTDQGSTCQCAMACASVTLRWGRQRSPQHTRNHCGTYAAIHAFADWHVRHTRAVFRRQANRKGRRTAQASTAAVGRSKSGITHSASVAAMYNDVNDQVHHPSGLTCGECTYIDVNDCGRLFAYLNKVAAAHELSKAVHAARVTRNNGSRALHKR